MPYTDKVQALRVVVPAIVIYARLEAFCDKCFLPVVQIVDTQAVPVAFITIAFHALPRNVFAVRTEFRIGVISSHLIGSIRILSIQFAQVQRCTFLYII